MATGDNKETAKNIAINLDMVDPSAAERNCISGIDLENMEASEHQSLFSNFFSGKIKNNKITNSYIKLNCFCLRLYKIIFRQRFAYFL